MKEIDIEEMKSIQMGILKYVDGFCESHNIKYFMCGGSLIGTIRHRGYIPWDDDIDIMMLREDYEKFISIFGNKRDGQYVLHEYKTDPYYYFPFAKIEDSRTTLKEKTEINLSFGVSIDLFPIDKIPDDKNCQRKRYSYVSFFRTIYDLKSISISKNRNIFKNLLLVCSHFLLKCIPFRSLIRHIEKVAMKSYNDDTKSCGIIVWGYGLREINKISNFQSSVNASFESLTVKIPIGYDDYLKSVYGDYMTLPPEEKRQTHHDFIAYWK